MHYGHYCPFHSFGDWGTDSLNNWPNFKEFIRSRARIGSQVLSTEFTPLTPRLPLWESMAVSLLDSTGAMVSSTGILSPRCAQWNPLFACSAIPAHLPCLSCLFSSHSARPSSLHLLLILGPPVHVATTGSRDELRKVSSHCFPLRNSVFWVLEIRLPVLVYLFTFFNGIIWWAKFLILLNQINQSFPW